MRALGNAEARVLGSYRLLAAITLVDERLVNDLFRARLRAEITNAAPAGHLVHVIDGDAAASPPWIATGFIPRATLRAAHVAVGAADRPPPHQPCAVDGADRAVGTARRAVPLDVAGVLAGCLAGSIGARAFRFAR